MTDSSPHRDGSETRTLAAPSLLPEGASLSDYTSVQDVLRKLSLTDRTLTKWARDPDHSCPPIYNIGGKDGRKRVMETAAVERWVRSTAEFAEDESDAPAA